MTEKELIEKIAKSSMDEVDLRYFIRKIKDTGCVIGTIEKQFTEICLTCGSENWFKKLD